jgi:hypothetical protein
MAHVEERARQAAENFVKLARRWPYEERQRFSLWLMDRAGQVLEHIGSASNGNRGRLFVSPQVIIDTVLLPTLAEILRTRAGQSGAALLGRALLASLV